MKIGRLQILILVLGLSLSACGGKKTETAVDSAAAIKINGQVVSDAEFQLKGASHQDLAGSKRPISADAMMSMINMELFRQAALADKLDKDPAVQARLANSQRSILAMVYMDKLISAIVEPTEDDVGAYYNDQPARFANRKHYELQELTLSPPADKVAQVQEQLQKLGKFEAFTTWLKQEGIHNTSNPLSITTDRMPDEFLRKIKDVPVGGYFFPEEGNSAHVIFVQTEQDVSVSLEQAAAQISGMLLEQRRKDALDNAVQALRDKARIEYVAPYTEQGMTVAEEE